MEIKFIQKELNQILLSFVTKLIFSVLIISNSCVSAQMADKPDNLYNIINAGLEDLNINQSAENTFLERNLVSSNYNEFSFSEERPNTSFLHLNYSMRVNLVEKLFNDKEIQNYNSQLQSAFEVDFNKLKFNIKPFVDDRSKNNTHPVQGRLISLGYPVINIEGEFALMRYNDGDLLRGEGSSGVMIFQIVNGRWKLIFNIPLTIS